MINWLSLLGCLPSTLNLAWGFLGGAVVKKILLPMQETQETWVRSLSWEDPLEKEMTTHSSIFT